MPDYRRFRVPGGTYFFTINLLERRSDLLARHINAVREAVRRTRRERPFVIDAWVVLPEHMHCFITLPEGDDDFSNRIKAIKIRFVHAIPTTERRSRTRVARGERAIWQRRFWEHAIRSDTDYARHMDYVHFNPSSMATSPSPATGRIPPFTVWSEPASTPPTGASETSKTSRAVRRFQSWLETPLRTAINPRKAQRDSGSATRRESRIWPAFMALIRRFPDPRWRRNGGTLSWASALRHYDVSSMEESVVVASL
jgi:putative transposase